MNRPIDERVEAYLDGLLSTEESAAFERDLADPAVATAFGQALMIREMLEHMPPETVPEALLARIEGDLLAELERGPAEADEPIGGRSSARAALEALAWTVRGPSLALEVSGANRAAASSLGSARSALGSLTGRGRGGEAKASVGRRGLRLLGRLVRRRK